MWYVDTQIDNGEEERGELTSKLSTDIGSICFLTQLSVALYPGAFSAMK